MHHVGHRPDRKLDQTLTFAHKTSQAAMPKAYPDRYRGTIASRMRNTNLDFAVAGFPTHSSPVLFFKSSA